MPKYAVEKHDSYGTKRVELKDCSEYNADLVVVRDNWNDLSEADDVLFDKLDIGAILSKLSENIMPTCLLVLHDSDIATYAQGPSEYYDIVSKAVDVSYLRTEKHIDILFIYNSRNAVRSYAAPRFAKLHIELSDSVDDEYVIENACWQTQSDE